MRTRRDNKGGGSGKTVLLFALFGAAVAAAAFFAVFFLVRTFGGSGDPKKPQSADSVIEAQVVEEEPAPPAGQESAPDGASDEAHQPDASAPLPEESVPPDTASSSPDTASSGEDSVPEETAPVRVTTTAPSDLGRKSAVPFQNAVAGSEIVNEKKVSADGRALLAVDGDVTTSWKTEGEEGEWICLTLGRPAAVACIEIYPGDWRSEKAFQAGGCPAEITLAIGNELIPLTFEEGMRAQYIVFDEPVMTEALTLTVEKTAAGQGSGVCISEILVYR